jgi:hypothetical protein
MGILACGDPHRESVQRGLDYLCRTQNKDGSWSEDVITGTGFPQVFYLKYDMYRNAWPLLALATHRQLVDAEKKNGKPAVIEKRNGNGRYLLEKEAPVPTNGKRGASDHHVAR